MDAKQQTTAKLTSVVFHNDSVHIRSAVYEELESVYNVVNCLDVQHLHRQLHWVQDLINTVHRSLVNDKLRTLIVLVPIWLVTQEKATFETL